MLLFRVVVKKGEKCEEMLTFLALVSANDDVMVTMVRKQKRSFAKEFCELKVSNRTKVGEWKEALSMSTETLAHQHDTRILLALKKRSIGCEKISCELDKGYSLFTFGPLLPDVLHLPSSIPINRGLIQAIPTSLPPQPIGEATKASNLRRILPGVQGRSHTTYFLYLISSESDTENVYIETLTLEQYLALDLNNTRKRFVCPDNSTFEGKGQLLRELRNISFSSGPTDSVVENISNLLEIASIFNAQKSTLVQVFPLTLEGIAKRWFERTSTEYTKSWSNLKQNFIRRFFPPAMIFKQLCEIRNFKQEDGESLFDTWERYNDLLFKCPFHDLNDHQKESNERQEIQNEWMKKIMISTDLRIKENVLVKISNFVFPVDFVIIDIMEDENVPIILGRPMLEIAHAKIDVYGKKISLGVGNDQVVFNINKKESPAFISPVCVINELDKTHELDDLVMNDEKAGDFENYLSPEYGSQDIISLSPSELAEDKEDFSITLFDPDKRMSIGLEEFVDIDDMWDDLDPGILSNEKAKTEFLKTGDESIDSTFARFNTIITSLKALDEGYSSKNYVRKFLRALHPKWISKSSYWRMSKAIERQEPKSICWRFLER
ncbi:putative reverse transcriptase, RNA-dependent DNA polymerase [Tanacetum coccineum]